MEVGYKAQVTDNDDGIVECGAAPDGPQLVPAIQRIARRTDRALAAVTADRGDGQTAVERSDLRLITMFGHNAAGTQRTAHEYSNAGGRERPRQPVTEQ